MATLTVGGNGTSDDEQHDDRPGDGMELIEKDVQDEGWTKDEGYGSGYQPGEHDSHFSV